MHKVVYNACYGGFGLSLKAIEWLAEHTTDLELKNYLKEKLIDERKSFIALMSMMVLKMSLHQTIVTGSLLTIKRRRNYHDRQLQTY